jgi:hypothetical protein
MLAAASLTPDGGDSDRGGPQLLASLAVLQSTVTPQPGAAAAAAQLANSSTGGSASSPASPAPALAGGTWTSIGPAPVTNGQTADVPMPVSGRIAALAADPTNANIIYVAAAGGGVWKTIDGGSSWTPLTDQQLSLSMGAIAVAASNPQIVYAGEGEANYSGDSFYGHGLLKSTDGGATWTSIGVSEFDRHEISKIVIDPNDASTLYVASSVAGVDGEYGNTGVWKSTDGGATWTNTTTSITSLLSYSDLVMDPTNSNVLYTAVGYPIGLAINGQYLNGVYKTTDGGATWSAAGNFPTNDPEVGRIALAIAPSSPQTIYASVADGSYDTTTNQFGATFGNFYEMFKSSDGGATWTMLSNVPNYMGQQGWYDTTLAVDPHNANIVYAAGQADDNSMIESFDGGQSWLDISAGADGFGPHADHHAIGFDANGRLLDGDDGGIFRLDNDGPNSLSWTDLNSNLNTIQFTGVALSPTNANIAYGGSQDNGTDEYNASLGWTQVQQGDGGYVRIDPNNPNIIYHTFYYGGDGFLERSNDGGLTWTGETNGINFNDPANFYPPYVMDPSNSNRLLLGTNVVYETTNQGDLWTPISTPGSNGWNSSNVITALAVSASNPNTIYAATASNSDVRDVFVSTNDGASWTESAPDPYFYGTTISDIVVDPTNSQVAYVTFANFNSDVFGLGTVFQTTDGGQTWNNITGNLPDIPVESMAIVKQGNGVPADMLIVGTDQGVYYSANQGATWAAYGSGLANAEVTELAWNPTTGILAAATHGRGTWETPIAPPTTSGIAAVQVAPGTLNTNINLFSSFSDASYPLSSLTYSVEADSNPGLFASLPINSSAGTLTLNYAANASGTATLTVRATDPQGLYVDATFSVTLAPEWSGYAGGPQHAADSAVASQGLSSILWQTPVDLNPQFSGNDLYAHYGSPVITQANTVIVPVKTGATGGFEVEGLNGANGSAIWTQTSDYIQPLHNWTIPFGPTLTPFNRLYFAGAGGTLYYINNPDSPGATVSGQVAFYGMANYTANESAYQGSVFIDTPLTSDSSGDIVFGFYVTGSNPLGLVSGIARIAPDGTATYTSVATASGGDSAVTKPAYNAAPAFSPDGTKLYVVLDSGSGWSDYGNSGDLVELNATTLAPIAHVRLKDPASGNDASVPDDSTASPMVGPDGDVYFGVLENPFPVNNDRGWMLHYSADLSQVKTPGAFGWDDTASVVPVSMVPSYHGTSTYLIMTKYNNYADPGLNGDGVNKIAVLDPNGTEIDPVTHATVMNEVLTIAGVTPDTEFLASHPNAVREWCINTAVVDPATDSILANSEDGKLYRWNLTTNTFTQVVTLTSGVGEAYTPTLIGSDGTVYAINDATLFAVGNHAPTLAGANPLNTIFENAVSNPGTLVSALISGQVADQDAGALVGIALIGTQNTGGVWQYSTTGTSGPWSTVGTVSVSNALLLAADANTLVRFVPNAGFSGTLSPALTFKAWDQSDGLASGAHADTTVSGGGSAFSSSTAASSLVVDAPPKVVGVDASGSTWGSGFYSALDANGLGSPVASGLGFQLADGANQLLTLLPWTSVDTLTITFSKGVTVSANSLTLYDSEGDALTTTNFNYNAANSTAQWIFSSDLAADKWWISLSAATVSDTAGAALDGEWTTSQSTFSAGSGDGTPGGDFNFRFNVLPGDVNDNGIVSTGDVLQVKTKLNSSIDITSYRMDINGSGGISTGDVLQAKTQLNKTISSFTEPTLPPTPATSLAIPATTSAEPSTNLVNSTSTDTSTLAGALTSKVSYAVASASVNASGSTPVAKTFRDAIPFPTATTPAPLVGAAVSAEVATPSIVASAPDPTPAATPAAQLTVPSATSLMPVDSTVMPRAHDQVIQSLSAQGPLALAIELSTFKPLETLARAVFSVPSLEDVATNLPAVESWVASLAQWFAESESIAASLAPQNPTAGSFDRRWL